MDHSVAGLLPLLAAQCASCDSATLALLLVQMAISSLPPPTKWAPAYSAPPRKESSARAACGGAAVDCSAVELSLSSMLQPLYDLLQATNAPPSAVVTIFAGLTRAYPAELVPELTAKLASAVPVQQLTSLRILQRASVANARTGAGATSSACLSRMIGREASVRFVRALLGCMASVQPLLLRSLACGLFGQIEPAIALAECSPWGCGAAVAPASGLAPLPVTPVQPALLEEALLRAVAGADPGAAVSALMDALRDATARAESADADGAGAGGAPTAPHTAAHPGQIGLVVQTAQSTQSGQEGAAEAEQPLTAATSRFAEQVRGAPPGACRLLTRCLSRHSPRPLPSTDQVLRVARKWASGLRTASEWRAVYRVGTAKFFGSARELASLRLLKALFGAGGVAQETSAPMLVYASLRRLKAISSRSRGAVGRGAESAEADEAGTYDRLRPLLLLNMLPEDCFLRGELGANALVEPVAPTGDMVCAADVAAHAVATDCATVGAAPAPVEAPSPSPSLHSMCAPPTCRVVECVLLSSLLRRRH